MHEESSRGGGEGVSPKYSILHVKVWRIPEHDEEGAGTAVGGAATGHRHHTYEHQSCAHVLCTCLRKLKGPRADSSTFWSVMAGVAGASGEFPHHSTPSWCLTPSLTSRGTFFPPIACMAGSQQGGPQGHISVDVNQHKATAIKLSLSPKRRSGYICPYHPYLLLLVERQNAARHHIRCLRHKALVHLQGGGGGGHMGGRHALSPGPPVERRGRTPGGGFHKALVHLRVVSPHRMFQKVTSIQPAGIAAQCQCPRGRQCTRSWGCTARRTSVHGCIVRDRAGGGAHVGTMNVPDPMISGDVHRTRNKCLPM